MMQYLLRSAVEELRSTIADCFELAAEKIWQRVTSAIAIGVHFQQSSRTRTSAGTWADVPLPLKMLDLTLQDTSRCIDHYLRLRCDSSVENASTVWGTQLAQALIPWKVWTVRVVALC
jgi:hypothetical protein